MRHLNLSTAALGFAAGLGASAAYAVTRKAVAAAAVGEGHPLKHRVLDLASGLVQRKYPLEAMSTSLNGLHVYADDLGRQVEASHFCIHLRHDLHQCVIVDRNAPDARLIGIEHIISEERFRSLPDDGQVDDALLRARDERVGVDTATKRCDTPPFPERKRSAGRRRHPDRAGAPRKGKHARRTCRVSANAGLRPSP